MIFPIYLILVLKLTGVAKNIITSSLIIMHDKAETFLRIYFILEKQACIPEKVLNLFDSFLQEHPSKCIIFGIV